MSRHTLHAIATARVPTAAFAEAITLIRAGQFGDFPSADHSHALRIVEKHGGSSIAAQALHTRLAMLTLLQAVDPTLAATIAALSPDVLGSIAARFRITIDGQALDFDGDALALAIRMAGETKGSA